MCGGLRIYGIYSSPASPKGVVEGIACAFFIILRYLTDICTEFVGQRVLNLQTALSYVREELGVLGS